MDSLTQVALGAAVGEAVAGHKLGRRAALWGAVAGTIPDLDVLAYPFLDPVGELRFHRGVTHGLPFAFVVGPLLGYAVWRFARWRAVPEAEVAPWRAYGAVFFWGLLTHPLLDVFTVYGTQLLAPFSDRPFAIGSTFIIDPVYTLPLLGFLVAALVTRDRRWAASGLAVSTLVLALGVLGQQLATSTVEAALAAEGVEADRLLVAAGPFTSLLWRGVAEVDDRALPFSLHVADAPEAVAFESPLPLKRFRDAEAERRGVATLRWFSRDWLTALPDGGVADLRFGRAGLTEAAPFVFAWDLVDGGRQIRQRPIDRDVGFGEFTALWRRAARLGGPDPSPRRTIDQITSDPPSP